MKAWVSALGLSTAVLAFVGGCASPALVQTTGQERFFIASQDLPHLKKRALEGDNEASRKVLNYYLFVAPKEREGDQWIRLAKSRGIYRQI
jgi:hypothetical protein